MYVLYKLLNDSVLVELRNKINFIQEIRLVGVKIQALHKVVVFSQRDFVNRNEVAHQIK